MKTSRCEVIPSRAFRAIVLTTSVAAVLGCAGQQYSAPAEGTPDLATASFLPASRVNSSLYVLQFDGKGCYQGRTEVPRAGVTPLRMVAAEERFFMMTATSNSDSCNSVVSFIPEASMRYRLAELKEFPHGILGVRMCGVRVEREAANSQFAGVESKHWRMKQAGLKCFRLVPASESVPSTLRTK